MRSIRSTSLMLTSLALAQNWPQAGGPDGTWAAHGPAAPVAWSVTHNQNIRWRTPLPNAGQSGIAIWGDRLFLTTFAEGEKGFSSRIIGLAVSAKTGKILWQVPLDASLKSPMLYAFSDSTTPSPVTDGKHVWFFNSSGLIACFTLAGQPVWQHKYAPWGEPYPFNKQHEPILFEDLVLNVEPLDNGAKPGWNYLRALDKNTGRTRWIAEDATTAYNTARIGRTADGTADGTVAILHGRGGWHDVPERPIGLSLTKIRDGKTIWRFTPGNGEVSAPQWQALYVMHWDAKNAYWFELGSDEKHLVLDSATGRLLREQSLWQKVDYRQWDPAQRKHIVHRDVNLREVRELAPRNQPAPGDVIRVLPVWHSNIVAAGYHYFLTTTGHRRNRLPPKGRAGPTHSIGRVHIATGQVEYLELPVTVANHERVYGIAVKTKTLNAKGEDVAAEERSRTDGWEVAAFFGSPIAVNDRLYFTSMLGITYVIDARAPVLDESALLSVNDLGPSGETWSLNSLSYASGQLYHRSAKELVAIGEKR